MRRGAAIAFLALLLAGAPLEARTRHKSPDPATETEHVVKSGESLILIARRTGVDQAKIIEANQLKPPYHLRIGQKLAIPRAQRHSVKSGETGYGIAKDYGVDWDAIAQASGIKPNAALRPGQVLTIPTGASAASPATTSDTPRKADPATTRAQTHTVQPGETGSRIASQYGLAWTDIAKASRIDPDAAIRPGQKLTIPATASPAPARDKTHVVQPGEIGSRIAARYGLAWSDIARASGIDPRSSIRVGQKLTIPAPNDGYGKAPVVSPKKPEPDAAPKDAPAIATDGSTDLHFQWPVEGPIKRGFVSRQEGASFHDGIDILADKGTKVHAVAAGKVIYAAAGPKAYGNTVILYHGDGWTSVYSYLDRIEVKLGHKVKAGKTIGRVGQTGVATQPQLHFELRTYRRAIDPLDELPKR